jgi:hypothetical protein
MRKTLLPTVAVLLLAGTTACSEATSEPTAVQTEALVASAPAWTPSDLTRDLQVDEATRSRIEAGIQALHASMIELHGRHATAGTLEGEARAAYVADMKTEMQAIHEQHSALWDSLDPEVQAALAARIHERMSEHDDETTSSLHERMRRMHGGDHDAGEHGGDHGTGKHGGDHGTSGSGH